MFRRTILSIVFLSFLTSIDTFAQGFATSVPKGIYTVKINGKLEGKSQARTHLGIPLLPAARYAGVVESVSGNTFTASNPPGIIGEAGREYYVHILDGAGRGFIAEVEEFRTDDILCNVPLQQWMEPGTDFLIREHPDFTDIFGADNRFGLTGSDSAENADNLVLWDPEVQTERVYYFNTVRNRWEETDVNADASRTLIRFPYGMYIIRRTAGNLRMVLSGFVGNDPVLLPVRTGANVFSLPINLSSSLENKFPQTGSFLVRSGLNANQADILTFEEPSGNQRGPFYLSTRQDLSGWREIGENESQEASEPIDPLATLIIRREGAASSVLVEGGLSVTEPIFALPPNPDSGEIVLNGELPLISLPPGFSVNVETSPDLQSWSFHAHPIIEDDVYKFPLPAGQTRRFYRLSVSSNP